jgi:hypothetical protein
MQLNKGGVQRWACNGFKAAAFSLGLPHCTLQHCSRVATYSRCRLEGVCEATYDAKSMPPATGGASADDVAGAVDAILLVLCEEQACYLCSGVKVSTGVC